MKRWRVGTFSMAVSLILMGSLLFASQFFGGETYRLLLSWWPLILVLLGAEILLYLFAARQEHPVIKYDIFSILFVGVLGMAGIALAVLSSVGITEQLRYAVQAVETTKELPYVQRAIPADIVRVVIDNGHVPVKVEKADKRELHLFGTYRTTLAPAEEGKEWSAEQAYSIKSIGKTMFVTILPYPQKAGPFGDYTTMNVTVVLPAQVQWTVEGRLL